MTKVIANTEKEINGLMQYLRIQRETMLNKWRTIIGQDLILASKISFSREEFNDQAPTILNILDQRMTSMPQESDPVEVAQEHGLHRWQRGYSLPELLTELEHLYWVVLDEIKNYHQNVKPLSANMLLEVHRQVFSISEETNRGSMLYYDQLRQTNAAEQANAMQQALDQLQQLSSQRSEHLRHGSHDLRSGFSVIMSAFQLLDMPTTKKERAELLVMLNKNLASIRDMLLQLTDYARIESGQEILEIKEFDAAALIGQVIENVQPIAKQRKLALNGDGPAVLRVTSDPVKVQRILQNLLLNALKYTNKGGIYISWAQENETRWILSIQDTGPGFSSNSPAALLAEQLEPLSQPSSSHQLKGTSEYPLNQPPSTEPIKETSGHQMKESEGLGLFIVKKICELLKASMDIESIPDQGTLIRIRFLCHHPSAEQDN